MATFDFNDGLDSFSPTTVSFTDDSVNFTLSTSGNGGANNIFYNPDDVPENGLISLTDSSVNGPFTLVVNDPVNNKFAATGGNITLNLGSSTISGTWNVTFVHATNAGLNQVFNNVAEDAALSFATSAEFSAIRFTPTGSGNYITIDSLSASIVCYLEDTGIDTPKGRVAVQDLRPGDTILTADGNQTTVKWVGVQPVETRLTHPAKVNPICLRAGAIAPDVPQRDLFVSPDHAIEINGLLFNASALVNGGSIYRVARMPLEGFTYYHVETDHHEVILAEGCPSESYLDMPDRSSFVNGAERADAPMIEEMNLPRITAARLVPQDIQDQLAERARALEPARRAA
ncbi:Hint domain-containing protein [Tropicibacter oceani]|uniref:Hint domain-containing protein n=1 Tax=Tropicibacter oceani TaxID=3058420 RepID=A0ABY8QG33_9RHOB|nr:Hint domain-containing protein [Tropicibacter oceani]WGW02978.1 Hint domain-containing protein [Tropicibacter oceani]